MGLEHRPSSIERPQSITIVVESTKEMFSRLIIAHFRLKASNYTSGNFFHQRPFLHVEVGGGGGDDFKTVKVAASSLALSNRQRHRLNEQSKKASSSSSSSSISRQNFQHQLCAFHVDQTALFDSHLVLCKFTRVSDIQYLTTRKLRNCFISVSTEHDCCQDTNPPPPKTSSSPALHFQPNPFNIVYFHLENFFFFLLPCIV